MKSITLTALAALSLTAMFAVAPASADMIAYKATLSGADEVPATKSKGTGSVVVTFDSTTKTLTWKGTYSGLTGTATGAHFHGPAEVGKVAGVAVPLPSAASPLEGSAVLSDAQAADLKAGKLYLNVHTAANPNGEIRGQVLHAE